MTRRRVATPSPNRTVEKRKAATKKPHRLVPRPRGESVARSILDATLDELARVGFGAFAIDDVARIAGVNKTTVYRRWPTKSDLVRAALNALAEEKMTVPDTGSLRDDLLALATTMRDVSGKPQGQCIIRMLVAEGMDPEVAALARSIRCERVQLPLAFLERATERGELSADVEPQLVLDALIGPIHQKMLVQGEMVDDGFLQAHVDLLLYGAAPRRKPTRASSKRRR